MYTLFVELAYFFFRILIFQKKEKETIFRGDGNTPLPFWSTILLGFFNAPVYWPLFVSLIVYSVYLHKRIEEKRRNTQCLLPCNRMITEYYIVISLKMFPNATYRVYSVELTWNIVFENEGGGGGKIKKKRKKILMK